MSGETSKVGERVAFMRGKRVTVRLSYAELGKLTEEAFESTLEDVIPLGREYFFVFVTGSKNRLVRCSSVIEVQET